MPRKLELPPMIIASSNLMNLCLLSQPKPKNLASLAKIKG